VDLEKDSLAQLGLDNFVVVVVVVFEHHNYEDLHCIVVVSHCVQDFHKYLLKLVLQAEEVVDEYNLLEEEAQKNLEEHQKNLEELEVASLEEREVDAGLDIL